MADFNGSFQYLAPNQGVRRAGECRVQFDAETVTVVPRAAAPITFDLGDLDGVGAENLQIRLPLYNGSSILLCQFGKAYDRMAHDLLEAFRNRSAQCLLLEDLDEITRFPAAFQLYRPEDKCPSCGARTRSTNFCPECGKPLRSPNDSMDCPSCGAFTHGGRFCPECGKPVAAQNRPEPRCGPAEIRLYRSNLAVLANCGNSFQWRLADIDAVRFEPGSHEVLLESGEECLAISGLAQRTEEFARRVPDAIGEVLAKGGQAIHVAFPFLNPDQLRSAADLLREGRSASVAMLAAIHPRVPTALAANAVDVELKPYYQELLKRTAHGLLYAGFKLVRPEEKVIDQADTSEENQEDTEQRGVTADVAESGIGIEADADSAGPDTLYWFFFPLAAKAGVAQPANVVAWEASSRAGRATYFFRMVEPSQASQLHDPKQAASLVETSVRKLNRVLAMLNFRRRPVYLSDDELEMNPRYHRYAIACRRIPELQAVRRSFLGRAIHSTPEAWQAQLASILARAGS